MSEFDIEVRTQLPREHYRYLLLLAEQHSTTVGALVREIVRRQLIAVPAVQPVSQPPLPRGATPEMVQRIRDLHARGESDSAIGRAVGISNKTVGVYRQRLGLPKNNQLGRPKKASS